MSSEPYGRVLTGSPDALKRSYDQWAAQPVDLARLSTEVGPDDRLQATLRESVSVSGPGTFFGNEFRTLTFEPSTREGWWFERSDQKEDLPIRISVYNVWTTVRNIVLRSGSPHNYVRMVEHIIALRLGMLLDNVVIRLDSGDPPLFDRGSLDLVEAVDRAGRAPLPQPAPVVTVAEPVSVLGPHGSFLSFLPREDGRPLLDIDCAIDFPTAIGRQRIQFTLTREQFRYGAMARTNTTLSMYAYCKTLGKIWADIRNLGYTRHNILVAGRRTYWNEAKMLHEGKSLEAAWHRAALDLVAAIALIHTGRFVGSVLSYKAGHALDVHMVRQLYRHDLLVPFQKNSNHE
ncbi:MAG: UDP-3-O-acyl-N-acetylglucosamine deacetylase [Kiritimatiellae bacterium]|nr:UDP-3-O-acyl-N-acetylglucosamine deacetylase [Kiritimatiellia bacterium]